jgi:hypothetical protein
VQGARSARALSGKQLEIVEQNGAKVLRVVGEDTSPPVGDAKPRLGHSKPPAEDASVEGVTHDSSVEINAIPTGNGVPSAPSIDNRGPNTGANAHTSGPPAGPRDSEHWIANLEHSLDPDEKAKLARMKASKTPREVYEMFGGDLAAARKRVRAAPALIRNAQQSPRNRRSESPICDSRSRIVA